MITRNQSYSNLRAHTHPGMLEAYLEDQGVRSVTLELGGLDDCKYTQRYEQS